MDGSWYVWNDAYYPQLKKMYKLKRKTLTRSLSLSLSTLLVSLSLAPFPLFSCFLFSFGKSQVTAGKKPQRIKKSNSKTSHLKYHLMKNVVCVLTMGLACVLQRIGGSWGGGAVRGPDLSSLAWSETFPTKPSPCPPQFHSVTHCFFICSTAL